MAGSFSCPPLQPISERCWHNYGVKWIRSYVEPEEQDVYYQHINSGVYRAAEVVREQVIDTAVNQVSKEENMVYIYDICILSMVYYRCVY